MCFGLVNPGAMMFVAMSTEAWNIVLSAVIVGLLIGGGIWLKYVVNQQLKSKDASIDVLKEVVKLKEALIASLQAESAPAIVKAYSEMRQHADQITRDYQNLLMMYGKEASKRKISAQIVPAQREMGAAHGLKMASEILDKHFSVLLFPDGENPNPLFSVDDPFNNSIYDAFLDAGLEISKESIKHIKAASNIANTHQQITERIE